MEVLLIEQNGRERSFPLDKGIIRVGNAPFCDVTLSSQVGAPLQLQLFYAAQQPDRCKVLNLGPDIWVNRQGGRQKLASSASVELTGGDELFIDTSKLIFKLPASSGVIRASGSIDASLSFPNPVLYPEIPNVGALTLRNTGKKASCQFQVRVYGLPGNCFRIDPAPLLHPDAEEQFLVHLFHRESYPRAGLHEIKFVISATQAYPGEEVMIRQQIYVVPLFRTQIELQDDMPAGNIVIEKHSRASSSDEAIPVASVVTIGPVTGRPMEKARKLEQNVPEDYWTQIGAK